MNGLLLTIAKLRRNWNDHIPQRLGNRTINRSRPHFSSINPRALDFVAQKVRETEDAASTTPKTPRPFRTAGLRGFAG